MSKEKPSIVPPEARGLIMILGVGLSLLSVVSFRSSDISANWLGLVGYCFAFALTYTFGLSSLLLFGFFGWMGLRLLKHKEIPQLTLRTLYFIILLISSGIMLNLIAELNPNFAAIFKSLVYTQTVTVQSSIVYQKLRVNLGGAPLYFLYRDLPLINLQNLLSNVGIGIVFTMTLLVSFLQLTKWKVALWLWKCAKEWWADEKKEEGKSFLELFRFKTKTNLLEMPIIHHESAAPKRHNFIVKDPKIPKPKAPLPPPSPRKSTVSSGPYTLPPLSLLTDVKRSDPSSMKKELSAQAQVLEETLLSFGIEAKVGQIHCGPTITSFEVQPAIGVKVQRITALEDDIALNLQAKSIRILAPIPGKAAVGVEVPSLRPQEVSFKEIMNLYLTGERKFQIPILLGKTVSGEDVMADLTKMPHCIIAGATGSGKSVCINTIVMSILMTATPDEIKLLMVDPKKVELTAYTHLPHLIAPVITEAGGAAAALNWLVKEMEKRYEILKTVGVRNIIAFNERKPSPDEPEETPKMMPYIVGIIDELADLMMVAASDIETPIARIAQMARAVGIHLILATQRPSREVITGLIKANFPARIAFKVASRVNSQIILDDVGAESLLGNGDMLFLPPGTSALIRTQGAFVRDEDIARVIRHIQDQAPSNYLIKSFDNMAAESSLTNNGDEIDELYSQAKAIVQETGNASTTFLQRKLKIGYARAASLMDLLEMQGIISPQEGSRPRKVLIFKDPLQSKKQLFNNLAAEDLEI